MSGEAEARVEGHGRTGWLCRTRADRVRLVEMNPAVRRARILAGLTLGLGVLAMAPWIGWWPLAIFALAPGPLVVLDRFLTHAKRPERIIAASLALHTTLILLGIALSGGVRSPLLPWVAVPVLTAAARFRLGVFLTGALVAMGGVGVAVVAGSPGVYSHDPAPMIGIFVLLIALVIVQQPLLSAESRWRQDAVLDPLTGLLNRQGLHRRFREVAEQARLTHRPVSLVVFDLDEFKRLNDAYGHARGDAVLKDVSYLLRKELRAFELLYRIGGEELLLVLPGADLHDACEIAEQARRSIETAEPAGLPLTASFGVCSAAEDAVDFEPMFQAADLALYEAKRSGRNRVACSSGGERPTVVTPVALSA